MESSCRRARVVKQPLLRAAARIAHQEFWLLWVYAVPLVFASNIPPPLFVLSLTMIPVLWGARRAARGRWSVVTPLDLPLTLLLLLGVVSVAASQDRAVSSLLFGEWVGMVALYYSLVNSVNHTRLDAAVWILLGLGAAMAVFGMLGLRYSTKFLPVPLIFPYLPKLELQFLNPRGFDPNIVGGTVAPVVPLAMGWAWMQMGAGRATALGIMGLALGTLLLTQSRGALLGVIVALGWMLLWRTPRVLWFVLVALGLMVLAFVLVGDVTGTPERLELWNRGVVILRDFPFAGVGPGRFESTVQTHYPLLLNKPGEPQPHAHNLYLQMGVDFGVGGFIAFVGLVISALMIGMIVLLRTRGAPVNWLALGLFSALLVVVIHGLLDAVTVSTKAGLVIWYTMGLMMALARMTIPFFRAENTPSRSEDQPRPVQGN